MQINVQVRDVESCQNTHTNSGFDYSGEGMCRTIHTLWKYWNTESVQKIAIEMANLLFY